MPPDRVWLQRTRRCQRTRRNRKIFFSADSFGGVGALVARPLFGWRLAAAGRCGCFWAAARSLTRSGHVAPSGHRRLQRTCGCLIRRLRAFEGRHLLLSCCLWLVVPAVVWMSFGCDPCARLGALRRSAGLVRRQRTSRCVPTFTRHWSRRAAFGNSASAGGGQVRTQKWRRAHL